MLSRNVWLKIASLPRQGLSVVFEDELSDIYISGYSRTNHNMWWQATLSLGEALM
jgi:hypothetical protein